MLARQLAIIGVLVSLVSGTAHAQQPVPKDVVLEWEAPKKSQAGAELPRNLFVISLYFREVFDAVLLQKLSRGLPTTILFKATVHRPGIPKPVSTTAQTCKVRFEVWDEVYIIERVRPGRSDRTVRLAPEGVLRYCTEITDRNRLLAGNSRDVLVGAQLSLQAEVLINPVSPEVLDKIKRWVSRPSGTSTASPGDALFSTFTGLFLQRIGDAERELKFTTKVVLPRVRKPRPAR